LTFFSDCENSEFWCFPFVSFTVITLATSQKQIFFWTFRPRLA